MASARTRTKTKTAAPLAGVWGGGDVGFKHAVTLLIAAAAFLGTMTAALRIDASGRAASAVRDGRAFIIKAIGKGNAGTQRYTLERGMMAEFQSLVMEGSVDLRLAQESLTRSEAAAHLQDEARLGQLRESLRSFSSLLSPPYFEETTGAIDVLRFGVDYMVAPPVKWSEMEKAKSVEASAWAAKSDGYIVIITILAVSLFLLGLSLTLGGWMRLLFAGMGCIIAGGAVIGILATAVAPVPKMSEEAIKSYVEGAGDLYEAGMLALAGGDSARTQTEVVRRADRAIASFGQALVLKPDYSEARRALGETHLLVARTLLFGREGGADPDQARGEVAQAVDCLSKVINQDRAETRVHRDLGWASLLAEDYGRGEAEMEKALSLAPDLELDLGLGAALGLVGQGRPEAGLARLEKAVRWAEAHPLASDMFSFRSVIHDLDWLRTIRPIAGFDRLLKRLKEAFVSISYRRTAEVKPTSAEIGTLAFARPFFDELGHLADRTLTADFPAGTERVDFLFDYSRFSRGCQVVQKVYWQGREAPWLNRVVAWEGGEAGRAAWSLRAPVVGTLAGLNPGRYTVELYVDGNLLQSGAFNIGLPERQGPSEK
jgi:tetratricopeptide (TPR) repeat protein